MFLGGSPGPSLHVITFDQLNKGPFFGWDTINLGSANLGSSNNVSPDHARVKLLQSIGITFVTLGSCTHSWGLNTVA